MTLITLHFPLIAKANYGWSHKQRVVTCHSRGCVSTPAPAPRPQADAEKQEPLAPTEESWIKCLPPSEMEGKDEYFFIS